jgi:lysophospholipase L1-like esterase
MRLKSGQKIVMIGDSITDAGRRDIEPPYGVGYMTLVRSFVTARHPDLGLTWENRGIGGDTVRHLDARWAADVIDERPDVLTVMIGINDVWRRFGDNTHEAVPEDEYRETLTRLIRAATTACDPDLYVGSPYMIEADRSDPMRAEMDARGAIAREVAAEVGATFIDVQAEFDRVLACSQSGDWADDRIHPNQPGHAVIAIAFLRAFGIDLS